LLSHILVPPVKWTKGLIRCDAAHTGTAAEVVLARDHFRVACPSNVLAVITTALTHGGSLTGTPLTAVRILVAVPGIRCCNTLSTIHADLAFGAIGIDLAACLLGIGTDAFRCRNEASGHVTGTNRRSGANQPFVATVRGKTSICLGCGFTGIADTESAGTTLLIANATRAWHGAHA
jgi:hypothetical protein